MVFKVVTLLAMAIFYGCYFAKMISQKKQGIQTDQLGKDKTGFVKFIEVSLKIGSYVVPIAELVSIFLGKTALPEVIRYIGLALSLFAAAIFVVAVLEMKENWRAGVSEKEKTELVTTGIYRISRNPAFLGFDLMYIGICLTFFNTPLAVLSIVTIILFHLQIVNVEEDFLIAAFGEEYLNYKKKVCRYLGRKIR